MSMKLYPYLHVLRSYVHKLYPLLLGLILAAGLAFRFFLAPNPGMEFDMATNLGWGRSAVELGLAQSYKEQVGGTMMPNYPPFSMMIFAGVAHTHQLFFDGPLDTSSPSYRILMKTPSMIADMLIGLILALLILKWRGRGASLLAAAVVAVHPAMFYESALWGQTDSLHTLILVCTLIALLYEQAALAAALFTLAFLTKAQSVMIAPLILAVYLLRPRTMLAGLIGFLAVLLVVLFPFALGGALLDIWNVYKGSVGYYSIISSSAYNFWWALLADKAWNKPDTDLLFELVSYRTAGFMIFGAIVAATAALLHRRLRLAEPFHQRMVILFSTAGLFALAFFLFLTQMHERYLFPFVALALPMAFVSVQGAVIYGLVSFLFFLNLLGFLPWTPVERALHAEFPALDVFFGTIQVCLFVLMMKMVLGFRKASNLAAIPAAVHASAKKKHRKWFPKWLSWPARTAKA